MPHDARLFSKLSGAVETILLDWCKEAHDINTDGYVGRFLNLDIKVIEQMWDNVLFALQDEHITENTEVAHVFPNIKKNNFNVLYRQDARMVQQDSFMGNNQFNLFASSAIHQIDYFVPGTIKRFHTLECIFMNHLYYHTPNVRNVYRYNSDRRWVKDINPLDYDYVLIPTNNNKLHWVMFIIVPAERRAECYDSI
jgi:Ulp1 family protease